MPYMPALAAIRCNPVLAQKYAAMLAAGKPPKVAITAVMKKLPGPARSGRAAPLVRLRHGTHSPLGNRIRVQVYSGASLSQVGRLKVTSKPRRHVQHPLIARHALPTLNSEELVFLLFGQMMCKLGEIQQLFNRK